MANAKRCDRCGTFYKVGDDEVPPFARFVYDNGRRGLSFDLCIKCMWDFSELIGDDRVTTVLHKYYDEPVIAKHKEEEAP